MESSGDRVEVFRLVQSRFSDEPLSGEGARLYGGRWNSKGIAAVYASATLSLAALEVLVHVDIAEAPQDYVAIRLGIPDGSVHTVPSSQLPNEWRRFPGPDALKRIGDEWLRSKAGIALRVPSALIPMESNILVNPAHPDMATVTPVQLDQFAFDPRLFAPKN